MAESILILAVGREGKREAARQTGKHNILFADTSEASAEAGDILPPSCSYIAYFEQGFEKFDGADTSMSIMREFCNRKYLFHQNKFLRN